MRRRRPAGSGARSRSPITTRSGWCGQRPGPPRRGRSAAGRRRRRCWCRPASRRTARAAGGCRAGRRRPETQRLVPSAAALRPSRVVANFQVTNGRPCSTANVHTPLRARASSTISPCSTSTPASRSSVRPAGGDRVGVGLGEDHAAYAGVAERHRARAGAAGVRAGLEGDHGRRTAGPLPRLRQRVGLGVRAAGAAVVALRDGRRRRRRAARSRPAGWVRAVRPGVAASSRARAIAACSAAVKPMSGAPHVSRDADSGADDVEARLHDGSRPERLRALPIRTFDRRSRSSTWSTGHWL